MVLDETSKPSSGSPRKRLTKREQREAARELARQKKELNREARMRKRSIAAEVRAGEREIETRDKQQKKARREAKNVYDAIGFEKMYSDGTCEVEEGLFSQTVTFSDISYQSASTEQQKTLFNIYAEILNYCNTDTNIQLNIINTPLSEHEIGNKVFFEETADPALNEYVDEYNEILNKKMLQGVSNLDRMRYLTFSIPAATYDEAIPTLQRTYVDITSTLQKLGCDDVRRLTGIERLHLIASQLRPYKEYDFDYDELLINGMTAKDSVCPMSLEFKPENMNDVYKSDDVWNQVLIMEKIGSQLTDNSLSQLADLPMPINVCIHVQPLDNPLDFVKSKLGWIDKEIIETQRDAVRKGYNPDIIPQDLAFSKNESEELLNELQYNNQRLFRFVGVVSTYAKTFEDLREQAKRIIDTARKQGITVNVLSNRQREGMNTMLPTGNPHIGAKRYLTTANVAIMMPFATQEVNQPHGGFYGQNKTSSNLIMVNRKRLAAPMGFVLGKPGSGKSFGVKREITNTYLQNPDDEFIIIDPNMEYPPIVEALGGTAFELSPASENHINVFDLFHSDHTLTQTDPFVFKTEAIMAITSVVIGDASGNLTPEERTIIDRCLRETYVNARNTSTTPVLGDFYEILKRQKDPAAARLVTAFELYVEGGLNYFNNHTNVDLDRRITSFSFKQLSGTMRIFAMLVLMDLTYNRMLYNFERGVTTWVYIDEMQTLFSIPAVVDYFDRFWSEGRKFNLIPTGISQLPERILEHEKAKFLLMNSDFIMLFKQSDRDRQNLSTLLGLSPLQEEAVSRTTDVGHGLLVAGAAIIPFKDEWPKGKLYDLWNTKPEEIAEQKRKLLQAQPAWTSSAAAPAVDAHQNRREQEAATPDYGAYQNPFGQEASAPDYGAYQNPFAQEQPAPAYEPPSEQMARESAYRPRKEDQLEMSAGIEPDPRDTPEGPSQEPPATRAQDDELARIERVAGYIKTNGAWNGRSAELIEHMGEDAYPPVFTKLLIKHAQYLKELGVIFHKGKRGIIQLKPAAAPEPEVSAAELLKAPRARDAQDISVSAAAPAVDAYQNRREQEAATPDYGAYQNPFGQEASAPDYGAYQNPFAQEQPAPAYEPPSEQMARESAYRPRKEDLLDEMGRDTLSAPMFEGVGLNFREADPLPEAMPEPKRRLDADDNEVSNPFPPLDINLEEVIAAAHEEAPAPRPAIMERRRQKPARGNRPAFIECPKCGGVIAGDSAFCPKCGARQ